jgi:hypothetical protein
MSIYRSSLASINNNVLQFARHNDINANIALKTVLTNIYTATPNAIIVQSGVNWRTTDFQAWATYYNPDYIFNPAAPNNLEIISQLETENNFAYTGTFEVFNQADLGGATAGNFFCLKSVDYQAPGVYDVITPGLSSMEGLLNDIAINNFNNTAAADITILWDSAGVVNTTTFSPLPGNAARYMAVSGNTPVDVIVMLWKGSGTITGTAIPARTTTGRYGILLNQYNTTYNP